MFKLTLLSIKEERGVVEFDFYGSAYQGVTIPWYICLRAKLSHRSP